MAKSPAQSEAQTRETDDSDLDNPITRNVRSDPIFGRIRIPNSGNRFNRVEFGLGLKQTRPNPWTPLIMAVKLSIFIFITKATSYSQTNACSCECMIYLTYMHVYGVSMCGHVICMFMVYQRENWKETLISIQEAKKKKNKTYIHIKPTQKRGTLQVEQESRNKQSSD